MKIGIIGGSGLEKENILDDIYGLKNIETPYGNPSSIIKAGNLKGNEVYIISRNGIKHESMADPFSKTLRQYLINSCEELNLKHHKKGTVITIEGPRFSTRAESFMFRNYAD